MASKPISGTSSRSSTSSSSSTDETRAHSAVHLIRGATAAVLGQRKVTEAATRRVAVQLDRQPTPHELSKIEMAANGKVSDDAEILEFEMEGSEAEGHFGPHVYDLYSPGVGENLVRVVRIPDWDAVVCPRNHVESTGSIGEIKLEALGFDRAKMEVELGFRLLE